MKAAVVSRGTVTDGVSAVGTLLANEGVMTVAVLFVVASALRQTGSITRIASQLLGRYQSPTIATASGLAVARFSQRA